jgi:phage-related protein
VGFFGDGRLERTKGGPLPIDKIRSPFLALFFSLRCSTKCGQSIGLTIPGDAPLLPCDARYGIFAIMKDVALPPKPVHWVGSSHEDLRDLPAEVAREIGYALWFAQVGDKHPSAKPLKGFKGAGVLEIVEDWAGDTYRAVYTVRFAKAVYVLHVFKKKSKSGIKTPRHEIELIEARLKWARADYERWLKETTHEGT